MKQDDDNGQWFYDRLKRGCETPISNSAVIYFLKQLMKNKSMATAQFLASAAFLVEELDAVDEMELKLMHEIAELKAALEQEQERLDFLISKKVIYINMVGDKPSLSTVIGHSTLYSLGDGDTYREAIDNAIKGEK